ELDETKPTNHNRHLLSLSSRPKRPGFFLRTVYVRRVAQRRDRGNIATQPRSTRQNRPTTTATAVSVIPTEATRLFPTHGVCAPGRAAEGPWQYRNPTEVD